jgi:predicted DNA binding CopG/RHH family protein
MQQPVQTAPSLTSSSFAGLLAALAAPAQKAGVPGDASTLEGAPAPTSSQGWQAEPAWNEDGLEDDVATLSYERALRAHARYRSNHPGDQSLTLPFDPEPFQSDKAFSAHASQAAPAVTQQAIASSSAQADPWAAHGQATALDRNLKSASITIRLSKAECAQLHKRAAEAGLTVSAYLRSCTFEAESLRALVKDTLAQLRSAKSKGNQTVSTPRRRSWLGWWLRFLPRWHSGPRIARA